MREIFSNPGILALLGTLFGGIGLAVTNHILGLAKSRQDAGAQIRAEQRQEIESLRRQLAEAAAEEQRLEAAVEKWQKDYYGCRDEKQKTITELMILTEKFIATKSKLQAYQEMNPNIEP